MANKRAAAKRGPKPGGIVRFGVIGVGGMGVGHCRAVLTVPRARLAAVCDANPERAKKVGGDFSVPWFSSTQAMFESGLCDAVLIATPHPLHAAPAIAAMDAGLHVITEKPMSERVSTADQMIAAAKRNRVAFAVIFQRRFEPVATKAAAIVASGALGRIHRTLLIVAEYRSQAYYNSCAWRATWAGEGGGVMMNQAPHMVDIFIMLAGMPCAILGRTETRMHKIEVEDLAEAMLKYPNGATGYLYCSTNEPAPNELIEIFGENGRLTIRNGSLSLQAFKPDVATHIRRNTEVWGRPKTMNVAVRLPPKPALVQHAAVINNMVRHLLCGEPLITPAAECIGSLELANAITLSSHLGRWVELPINRRAYDRLLDHKRRTARPVKRVKRDVHVTDPNIK